jgi:hypothetical protein
MSSNAKRLWVINLTTNTILYNSLVAHGGIQEMNLLPVFQIQLNRIRVADFMLGEIYSGKHGKSLRLDGLEKALIATLEKSDCYTWSRICF